MLKYGLKHKKLQRGQAGEMAAEYFFKLNKWHMVRTQPAIQIVKVKQGKHYGVFVEAKLVGKGGVPDYTGYSLNADQKPIYRACEVKEAKGDTMPASRLDEAQRAFLASLPFGSAFVGILWVDFGKFEIHPFKEKGSYKRGG